MKIKPVEDKDGTDAVVLFFSNKPTILLNNMQLDTLKKWLDENWGDAELKLRSEHTLDIIQFPEQP